MVVKVDCYVKRKEDKKTIDILHVELTDEDIQEFAKKKLAESGNHLMHYGDFTDPENDYELCNPTIDEIKI